MNYRAQNKLALNEAALADELNIPMDDPNQPHNQPGKQPAPFLNLVLDTLTQESILVPPMFVPAIHGAVERARNKGMKAFDFILAACISIEAHYTGSIKKDKPGNDGKHTFFNRIILEAGILRIKSMLTFAETIVLPHMKTHDQAMEMIKAEQVQMPLTQDQLPAGVQAGPLKKKPFVMGLEFPSKHAAAIITVEEQFADEVWSLVEKGVADPVIDILLQKLYTDFPGSVRSRENTPAEEEDRQRTLAQATQTNAFYRACTKRLGPKLAALVTSKVVQENYVKCDYCGHQNTKIIGTVMYVCDECKTQFIPKLPGTVIQPDPLAQTFKLDAEKFTHGVEVKTQKVFTPWDGQHPTNQLMIQANVLLRALEGLRGHSNIGTFCILTGDDRQPTNRSPLLIVGCHMGTRMTCLSELEGLIELEQIVKGLPVGVGPIFEAVCKKEEDEEEETDDKCSG